MILMVAFKIASENGKMNYIRISNLLELLICKAYYEMNHFNKNIGYNHMKPCTKIDKPQVNYIFCIGNVMK